MKKKVRILSLDGGGIRGIVPASVLLYVEEYLQRKKPGTTIADHFDLIAGTSTGGILACIYLAPDDNDASKAKFSASEALDFYAKHGFSIFNASKNSNFKRLWGLKNATMYDEKNMENLLKEKFKNLRVSQLRKNCLITTYNMISKSSFFFSNNEDPNDREFYVHDVTRSTSAAPTYFTPAKIQNIAPNASNENDIKDMINLDGGVFANNPLMCAYAEARNTNFIERNNNKPSASSMYILSIGTGGGGFKLDNKEKSNKWNLLNWAKSIPDIMMDGSVDTVDFQMNEIRSTFDDNQSGDYMRVDVPKANRVYDSDMSNASKENIDKLLLAGKKTIEHAQGNGLDKFLDGLID
jgi:patatin-like phospholipase/acyl hydrolase